jgi:hypothetical protein
MAKRRTKQGEQIVQAPQAPQAPPPAGFSLAMSTPPPQTRELPPGFRRSVDGVIYCECGLTLCHHFAEAGLR